MIRDQIVTPRRAFAIASCLAVAACGSPLAPGPSEAAAPLATPTPRAAPSSPHPAASFPPASLPPPISSPTPRTTVAAAPAKPTGVTFTTDIVELPGPTGTDEITFEVTHTVTWKTPRTQGLEIRVYGVTACLSEPSDPAPGTSGPCLVEHTRLPSSVMVLAATAPAAAGEISWLAPTFYECAGPPVGPDGSDFQATVVAAYNDAGHSIFAIADPGAWWRADPNDVIC